MTFGIKRRSTAPRPRDITTTVLNGNGVAGSAANAAYELGSARLQDRPPADRADAERSELPVLPHDRVLRHCATALQGRRDEAREPVRRRRHQAVARRVRHARERRDGHARCRAELPRVDRARAGGQDADAAAAKGDTECGDDPVAAHAGSQAGAASGFRSPGWSRAPRGSSSTRRFGSTTSARVTVRCA